MAARLIAEQGVSRQFGNALGECLRAGDRLFAKAELGIDDYAVYSDMNNRFHKLIVDEPEIPRHHTARLGFHQYRLGAARCRSKRASAHRCAAISINVGAL
jgi:hypothetical protein